MLYRTSGDGSTATGRNIAHSHRTTVERALLGADLHLERVRFTAPTVGQAAHLVGASRFYVHAALRIADDAAARAAVLAGEMSLLEAAKRTTASPAVDLSLADRLSEASPAELLEAARSVGTAFVWDNMLAPLV